ncbi:Alpha/Beta hydrolase protein [Xylariales sp. AK1849]|nr:Alpha/Beta hydrolase protein [Xylariales sp. AK1849]
MKPSSWTLVSSVALSAIAGPIPDSLHLYLDRQATTVTTAEVTQFHFFAEYAAAGYCNSDVDAGTAITCADNACPDVEAAGAVVNATFAGVVTDVEGFVATDETNKLIVASFRGTHSIRNWITDFVFTQSPCNITALCLLHDGFYDAWLEVADDVTTAVATAAAAHPDYAIVFTGHSLGAAVATVAAAYVRNDGHAIDIYTYGSPRAGNLEFVQFVTDQAGAEYRVTHLDDPVPRLPPIVLNYRHTSPEYWLATGNATTTDYTASDITVCEGYANVACNGGTTGLDIDAHGSYFEDIGGCSPDSTPFKRRDDNLMIDADVATQLDAYVAQDVAYVATNLSNNVWS